MTKPLSGLLPYFSYNKFNSLLDWYLAQRRYKSSLFVKVPWKMRGHCAGGKRPRDRSGNEGPRDNATNIRTKVKKIPEPSKIPYQHA